MKPSIVFITTLALFALISCDRVTERLGLAPPHVSSVFPDRFASGVPGDVTIQLAFSERMDAVRTSEAFSLTSPSGRIAGYFRWSDDGRIMSFTPASPLADPGMHTISLDTTAEDHLGNDLAREFHSFFSLRGDVTRPRVVSHSPAFHAENGVPDPVVAPGAAVSVIFSEAIDVDTLHRGFSVSPAVQGLFSWNETRTGITFDPMQDFSWGSSYTVTLGQSIADISGNTLECEYSFSFTIGDDFTGPAVLSVTQESTGVALMEETTVERIEKREPLTLRFSEPVSRESLAGAISLSPSCSFHVEAPVSGAEAKIVFDRPLESETGYALTIDASLSDVNGNRSTREARFFFTTNGARSIRPAVSFITDETHGPYAEPPVAAWAHDRIETLEYMPPVPPSTISVFPGVYLRFTQEIDPASVRIDITREAGCGTGLPLVVNPDWPDISPDGAFHVYRFDLADVDAGDIYRITVRGGPGGLRDAFGNTMEEDYTQCVRF